MNRDEFEAKFKEDATAWAAWSIEHGKFTLAVACFIIGWFVGKFG